MPMHFWLRSYQKHWLVVGHSRWTMINGPLITGDQYTIKVRIAEEEGLMLFVLLVIMQITNFSNHSSRVTNSGTIYNLNRLAIHCITIEILNTYWKIDTTCMAFWARLHQYFYAEMVHSPFTVQNINYVIILKT